MKKMKVYAKLFLVHFLLLLINSTVIAQNTRNQKDKAFINWFFRNADSRPYVTPYNKDSVTVYVDGLNSNRIAYIEKQLLNQDTLVDMDCKKNRVILSPKEKEYISRQLQKMKTEVWQANLLANSILISKDTIDAVFKKPLSAQFELFSKYPHGYSFFSKPIFLRNGTLCIFYCGYNCAQSCFDDHLLIFRKEGEQWMELISLIDTVI